MLNNELEIGRFYKNIKQLCKILKLQYNESNNSRQAIIKEIECYYKLERKGNGYLIKEKYDIPKEKPDKRINNGGHTRKEFSNFLVKQEDENKIGVYKIVLDNNIYIGSTTRSFRKRFLDHNKNQMPNTYKLLKNGAIFEIIEICDGLNEIQIRKLENEYIKQYQEDKNWNLVNNIKNICKQKFKTIKIKVKEEDYEDTILFLKENDLI